MNNYSVVRIDRYKLMWSFSLWLNIWNAIICYFITNFEYLIYKLDISAHVCKNVKTWNVETLSTSEHHQNRPMATISVSPVICIPNTQDKFGYTLLGQSRKNCSKIFCNAELICRLFWLLSVCHQSPADRKHLKYIGMICHRTEFVQSFLQLKFYTITFMPHWKGTAQSNRK